MSMYDLVKKIDTLMESAEPVAEKISPPIKTDPSERGKHAGKTIAELKKQLASVKDQMASYRKRGEKVPADVRGDFSELTFAIRAKQKGAGKWGAIKELEEAIVLEKTMTPAQKEKREEIVKAMKKDAPGMKERYGKRWREVMYATATKQAMAEATGDQAVAEEGVAEGSLNEGQYEMMMSNGQVKKFVAKDDADAKRIAKGHGAKSVIRLKGGVPAGKVSEQGVAEAAKWRRDDLEGKTWRSSEWDDGDLSPGKIKIDRSGKDVDDDGDELNTRPGMWRGKSDMAKRITKKGAPTKSELGFQDNLKMRMRMKQKQGGLAGPKGNLPEQGLAEAKPDFLDIDKDGNKTEPMKKAAKDAKKSDKKVSESINVNISATDNDAFPIIMKLAGVQGLEMVSNAPEQQEPEATSTGACMEAREEEIPFDNKPNEKYSSIRDITRAGKDLNRPKSQHADKAKLGDNPLATDLTESLWKAYEELKVSK